jgi:catechol 2,3-dioxygenase-like lactoylglutathione lyase family enzyme
VINGAHAIIYSKDAEADRAFFKDVLGFRSVDVGGGWLIFALPSAEIACHPAEENNQHEIFLMCEDLKATIAALDAGGIQCTDIQEPPWGTLTKIKLPGGGELGLYSRNMRGHDRACSVSLNLLAPDCWPPPLGMLSAIGSTSSLAPLPYMFAVSKKFMPSSSAR